MIKLKMKKIRLKIHHWSFIISIVLSLYILIYGLLFLYRKEVYYNYILVLIIGIWLGFQLGRFLKEN